MFAVKDALTEDEIQSGRRAVIKDGMATTSMATLTGGRFLGRLRIKARCLQLGNWASGCTPSRNTAHSDPIHLSL